jgi:hypothetical protein
MKLSVSPILALLAVFCITQTSQAADSPYKDLLRRLPDSTNALVVANVPALRQALGVAPGTTLMASDFPIAANQFVMGAQLDLGERRHLWSIAMCQLARKMPMQDVAKAENEPVDDVAGYSVVASQRNGYFVELGPELFGAGSPANRQQLKRWLSYQKTNQLAALSPYLLQAANPSDPALVVMAVDLADSLCPTAVHRGLNGSKVLASVRNADYEGVGKTLCRAKGVTFTIRPGSPLNGEITVDFDTDTAAIRNFGKSLLIEILQHAGVYVPDFDDWRPRLKERSIGIYGPLSFKALRKFGTMIRTPVPPPEAADMATYASLDPAEQTKAASLRYFKSVSQLLQDLKEDKTAKVRSLAGWYDKYADQIGKLPILNVDPELIGFGSTMSENLRAMGASLRGISLQSGYLQRQKKEGQIYTAPSYEGNYNAWGPYGGYYGGWGANLANNAALYRSGAAGGVTTVNNFDQIYQMQDQLVTAGAASRIALWQRIDDETAAIRKQMTLKYKVEF